MRRERVALVVLALVHFLALPASGNAATSWPLSTLKELHHNVQNVMIACGRLLSPGPSATERASTDIYRIAKYAYMPAEVRDADTYEAEVFFDYKDSGMLNRKKQEAAVVDLGHPEVFRFARNAYLEEAGRDALVESLEKHMPGTNFSVKRKSAITIYEERVLLLKKGDTAVFGEHRFTLGRFLGAGNSTHVWELVAINGETSHNGVLRIPFLSAALSWTITVDGKVLKKEKDPILGARNYARLFVELANLYNEIPRVQIKQPQAMPQHLSQTQELLPTYAFVVVERLNVIETGESFVRRVAPKRRAGSMSPIETHLLEELFILARKMAEIAKHSHSVEDYMRQFMLVRGDDGQPYWKLADWE